MPIITKAATPLRMPRYLTPNTTWYKKRAIKQLSPMLVSPKKVRKTAKREEKSKELINILQISIQTLRYEIRTRQYCTRKGGQDIDKHSNADSTDDGQHHIVVESASHLIIK